MPSNFNCCMSNIIKPSGFLQPPARAWFRSVIANVAGNWADQRGDQQVNDQSPMMIMMRELKPYVRDTTLQQKDTYTSQSE